MWLSIVIWMVLGGILAMVFGNLLWKDGYSKMAIACYGMGAIFVLYMGSLA